MTINPESTMNDKREYLSREWKQDLIDRLDDMNFQLSSERMWHEFELLAVES